MRHLLAIFLAIAGAACTRTVIRTTPSSAEDLAQTSAAAVWEDIWKSPGETLEIAANRISRRGKDFIVWTRITLATTRFVEATRYEAGYSYITSVDRQEIDCPAGASANLEWAVYDQNGRTVKAQAAPSFVMRRAVPGTNVEQHIIAVCQFIREHPNAVR